MLKFTYLLLTSGAIATAVAIGLWRGKDWLYEWRRLLRTLVIVAVPFIAWDISAIWRGHWGFNPEYTLGLSLVGLPLEEILFFIAIPLVTIAVWEAMPVKAEMGQLYRPLLWSIVAAGALLFALNIGHEYSQWVSVVTIATAGLWLVSPQPIRHYMLWLVIMMALFIIANTVLTLLPVVEYSAVHYSGIRIGSIPLEDLFYNFALVNITILAWLLASPKQTANKKV